MGEKKIDHFFVGILIGTGLGILLAPPKNDETNNLNASFNHLIATIKEVDLEETKAKLFHELGKIKEELAINDTNEAKDMINQKKKMITKKFNELIHYCDKQKVPMVSNCLKDMEEQALNFLEEIKK